MTEIACELERTRVKICGLTRIQDAAVAAESGVDAIGFVFFGDSPRFVDPTQAAVIAEKFSPFVTIVGLFVNADAEWVRRVLTIVKVDVIQFHGDEPREYCESFERRYIKAVRVSPDLDIAAYAASYRTASALLVDAYVPGQFGGTGATFDWTQIPRGLDVPLVLAGGITPENARDAIQQVRPYALDVSSGVESAKGIKDARKIKDLFRAIHNHPTN